MKTLNRSSGILMPMSSLPSEYGIGTMGKCAYEFVDFLKAAGQKYWQLLPMGPTSYGDSPYASFSSFAGNPYFIDLELLLEEGLLENEDVEDISWGKEPQRVDYGLIYEGRFKVLRKAFERGRQPMKDQVEAFRRENREWIENYALFMAVKAGFKMVSWPQWPDEGIRLHKPEAVAAYSEKLKDEIDFYIFMQYLFFRQWDALREYAKKQGIQFIGDIPIYVAMDSADVWSAPQYFQLDGENVPTEVSGVPPDSFTEDGQLWGNPLYNWPYHKQTGYAWWIRRVRHALGIYDLLRIDHFRGFDTYWAIPAGSSTACTGKWEIGPRMDLFHALEAALGKLPIIAEDLGELFPSVRELLADSTFPGMKVLQFAFGGGDNEYLPHNHVKNSVVYPGTHDNTTLTDWWENAATGKEKANAAAYLHLTPCKPTAKEVAAVKPDAARIALLRAALGSVADRAIIPMPDWLGLGAEAHLNTPGKLGGNWTWRAAEGFDAEPLASRIQAECEVYCRAKEPVEKEAKTSI